MAASNYIIGINPISELLKLDPERILRVKAFIPKGKLSPRKKDLFAAIENSRITIERMSLADLDELVKTDSHQGFVAEVKANQPISLKEFIQRTENDDSALLLLLDGVEDPHNLGAIFRAAECFGVNAVAWSSNRGSQITPVVSKSSAGASELITHFTVSNLAEALRKLKKSDFWIVGAAVGEGSLELGGFSFPKKAALVLGAEGKGLSRLVSEYLDFSVYLPMSGRLDSLNVSQAAAVFLYQWSKIA
ncbi:MAG: 23S rRNA (guanosine(2251)-2'-O)-methyltransferase RlmB [Bdellovibrionota bacterium]